jgi:hypothetical protein
MLVGAGAEEFARCRESSWFPTNISGRRCGSSSCIGCSRSAEKENDLVAFGTVGAVALDADGNRRRGHVHRRHDGQTLGTRGRLAHHRRRHLREQRELRGLGHRARRILHRAVVAHDICAQVEYLKLPLRQPSSNVLAR